MVRMYALEINLNDRNYRQVHSIGYIILRVLLYNIKLFYITSFCIYSRVVNITWIFHLFCNLSLFSPEFFLPLPFYTAHIHINATLKNVLRLASRSLLSHVTPWRGFSFFRNRNVEIPANEINICSLKAPRRICLLLGRLIIRTYSRSLRERSGRLTARASERARARASHPVDTQGDGFYYFPRHDDELSNVRQNIGYEIMRNICRVIGLGAGTRCRAVWARFTCAASAARALARARVCVAMFAHPLWLQ